MTLGEIKWERFKDGFPNLEITDHHKINAKQASVTFLAALDLPESIFEQIAVIYALAKYRSKNYKVIVPYFATGTMERISRTGEIATAMTLARILSATPHCSTGPVE